MNNKRLNLAIIDHKPQLKHVPYGTSTSAVAVEEPVAAAAPVGTECLAIRSMPVNTNC
jgi:hypothetical protein